MEIAWLPERPVSPQDIRASISSVPRRSAEFRGSIAPSASQQRRAHRRSEKASRPVRVSFARISIPCAFARQSRMRGQRTDCLSVLTDEKYFQGVAGQFQTNPRGREPAAVAEGFHHRRAARSPLKAAMWGADAILLIVAILKVIARSNMSARCWRRRRVCPNARGEVHDEEELGSARWPPVRASSASITAT